MKRKEKIIYPEEICSIAVQLGERIRIARVRRKIRQEDLAARTRLSRSTIQAIERGESTCAFGSVLQVLWVLGLAAEMDLIGDPGLDSDGLALSLSNSGRRVRIKTEVDDDF